MTGGCHSDLVPKLEGSMIIILDGHHRRIRLVKRIGAGGWGVVFRAEDVDNVKKLYAVKAIATQDMNLAQRTLVEQEVRLHNACAHRNTSNVLRIIDVVQDEDDEDLVYIVSEFCEGGDLFGQIQGGKYVGRNDAIKETFLQIIDAVESCHKRGIYHRDLKPENILVKNDGSVVLGDFGFATRSRRTADFGMGTYLFMSPEAHGGVNGTMNSYSSPKADIWALGIILVNLITRCIPWGIALRTDPNFVKYGYHDEDFFYNSFPISRDVNDILKSILTFNPRMRTTISELRRRVLEVETFWEEKPVNPVPVPAAGDFTNLDHYSSEGVDSESKVGPLRVVNGPLSTSSDATVIITSEFVNQFPAPPSNEPGPSSASTGSKAPDNDAAPFPGQIALIVEAENTNDDMPISVQITPVLEADIAEKPFIMGGRSDSETDSEGPITPETHAVDDATIGQPEDLDEFAELNLGDADVVARTKAEAVPIFTAAYTALTFETHVKQAGKAKPPLPPRPPRNPARGVPSLIRVHA